MTKRIFGKLILSIVLLLAIWGLGADYLVSHITERNLQQDQVVSLSEKTRLVRSLLEQVDEAEYPALVDRLAQDANARITAIASDGSVIADSEADLGMVGYEMAVFGEQAGSVLTPELRAELKGVIAP